MNMLIDIQEYHGGKYVLKMGNIERLCPIYNVSSGMWIVGNEHLSYGSDIEFTSIAAKCMAEKLVSIKADTLITAGSKAVALAYEVAKLLGFHQLSVARKNIGTYLNKFISSEVISMTSGKKEKLYLDDITVARMKGGKVILFDDVISTGSTMHGMLALTKKAEAEVAALASIWIEGPWPFEQFSNFFKAGKLIFLDVLPVFAEKEKYKELCSTRDRIIRELNLPCM